jgi:hypothetical protein
MILLIDNRSHQPVFSPFSLTSMPPRKKQKTTTAKVAPSVGPTRRGRPSGPSLPKDRVKTRFQSTVGDSTIPSSQEPSSGDDRVSTPQPTESEGSKPEESSVEKGPKRRNINIAAINTRNGLDIQTGSDRNWARPPWYLFDVVNPQPDSSKEIGGVVDDTIESWEDYL